MDIQDLNKMSPLRVFDKAINGGLGKGNLGVIVSRHGVGKTACLVHLATDKLMRNENVIHVSFAGNVEHVMNWYKEVFREISEVQSLDDAHEVYAQILSNIVVMNFPVFLYTCVIVCHRMHFEQWDDSFKEDIKFCTLKDSTKVFSKNDTHKM